MRRRSTAPLAALTPLLAALAGAALLTGCGAGPSTSLTVSADPGESGPARTWELTCDPAGGDHPAPAQACRSLETAETPFAPVPPDAECTLQYGGPQTATMTGTWRGEPVDAAFSRTDGCEIARWDAVQAALVISGGVA